MLDLELRRSDLHVEADALVFGLAPLGATCSSQRCPCRIFSTLLTELNKQIGNRLLRTGRSHGAHILLLKGPFIRFYMGCFLFHSDRSLLAFEEQS